MSRDLLTISRELAAIAQTGLAYAKDGFDQERYRRLLEVAGELLGPMRVDGPVFTWPLEAGYATPKVDVRGVVFRKEEVLLVREASSGLWSLPGGWADVNLSPAQNVEKECREESGYEVRARAITSIKDRDQAGYPAYLHAVYKIYFLCDLIGGEARTNLEVTDIGFFSLDALPDLDLHRIAESEIRTAFSFLHDPVQAVSFN